MSYRNALKGWAQANLTKLKPRSDGEWADFCCAHGERDASAAINLGSGWVHCNSCGFSGWSDQYATEYGLSPPPEKPRDGKSTRKKPRGKMVVQAEYVYRDAANNDAFKVIRKGDEHKEKTFLQMHWDGSKWVWGMKGVERLLYRLPELLAADPSEPVLFVEGEKDVHQAERLRFVATTTPQGAESPEEVKDWSPLSGRTVVIVPDNDQKGRKYALKVAEFLEGVAASVKVLRLPGLRDKGDLSDWVAAGGDRAQLVELFRTKVEEVHDFRQFTKLQEAVEDWEPFSSLDDEIKAPPWIRGCLPAELEEFTDAIAEHTQTPPGMSKAFILACLACAAHGSYEIDIEGRTENLALYVAVGADTGERKSAVYSYLYEPFLEHKRTSIRETRLKVVDNESDRKLLEKRAAKLFEKAMSGKPEDVAAYKAVEREKAEIPVLVPVDVTTGDITPEALVKKVYQQGGAVGILGPEAGPIQGARDKYKGDQFNEIYVKFFSGESEDVNRKSEGADCFVPRSSLVIAAMIQPFVLFEILRDRELGGRGYPGRFLYSIPESRVGKRVKGAPVPGHLKGRYRELIFRLLPTPGARVSGEFVDRTRLYLTGKGLELYDYFLYQDIEPKLGQYGELQDLRAWANRLATLMLKIGTLWHIADAALQKREVPEVIDHRWIARAIVWAKMFALPMALKAYGYSKESPVGDMAARVLQGVIEYGKPSWNWSTFAKKMFRGADKDELRAALDHLVECNYLRVERVKTGGRSAVRYEVNPLVLVGGQKADKSVQKGGDLDKSPTFEELLEHKELLPYKSILSSSSSSSERIYGDSVSPKAQLTETRPEPGQKGQKEEALVSDLLEGII